MPVENNSISAVNQQFVCADPRNGSAVFEFVKPKNVGLVQPGDDRETLCTVWVEVNPKSQPLFERLHCEVRLDHDYIAHVHVTSVGRGAISTAEIHKLDFGLAMNPGPANDDAGGGTEPVASPRRIPPPIGTAQIRGSAGAVAFRPNVVPVEKSTAITRHAVAGDVAKHFWPAMFNPDRPEATRRQHDEAMYYVPCAVCGRNLYQIETEGPVAGCDARCFPQRRRQRRTG